VRNQFDLKRLEVERRGKVTTTETSYGVISIGEQSAASDEDRVSIRLRADLDIGAFGASAVKQKKAGEPVITEHDEVGPGGDGHEELYVVMQGHATFTVDGDEIDAPQGTVVFVREPAAKRQAIATVDGTTVLAVGGRRGEPYRLGPGASLGEFFRLHGAGDYEGALAICEEALETFPGNALILYNVACLESLLGRADDALATLRTSVEAWPGYKENAREDDDFASLRDDPRFTALIATE
jgi:mannose-6-phosphate isomerase-like protein (cupin superfamily)